jgi:MFS family permease
VLQWDLVCGSAYKSDLVQSLFMAGLLVGNLVGGTLADQRGRRDVLIIGSFGLTLFSILAAAPFTAPNFVLYVTWRVAAGVCTGAYGLVSFTLPAELVSSAERGFVNVVTTVSFALGVASLAPLAYVIRDWRLLSLVTAAPGLVGFYYYM